MINYLLQGFSCEMEKIALSRYAIEDHSDEGGESQFLHRKAGSGTYEASGEYIPPSKKGKGKGLKYLDKAPKGSTERVFSSGNDEGTYDYQTNRLMMPDEPIREFK